jgi:hypothetical protein
MFNQLIVLDLIILIIDEEYNTQSYLCSYLFKHNNLHPTTAQSLGFALLHVSPTRAAIIRNK